MKLYSTNNKNHIVDLREAVMHSLAPDGGLYMPCNILSLPQSFFDDFYERSFQENSYLICEHLLEGYIPSDTLRDIVYDAINFPAPLVRLGDSDIYSLELFHGPSLAFKDFGARFMARLMAYFNRENKDKLTILVATSGDTGGAVAAGFYNTPGIEVIILYPSGKVSNLQEKQLTTLGKNITALEVDGSFDDCQRLVKTAFLDKELNQLYRLSSANSINIARLIPQCFYYFEAIKQLGKNPGPITISVPSGNFGNLTAGLIAKKLGLEITKFIASTNINNVVPKYLDTGIYHPIESIATISNAMDVGNPSNFVRIMELYRSTWNDVKNDIEGNYFSDAITKAAIQEIFEEYHYIAEPHGAVAYLGIIDSNINYTSIFLETAHPSKFLETMKTCLNTDIIIPERLLKLTERQNVTTKISHNFQEFKTFLITRIKGN